MNRKGYTLVELLILIIGLGLVALIFLPKMSTAFVDNKKELYESDISLYLDRAEAYGNDNKEMIMETPNYSVTIKDLADAGYIGLINNDVIDIRDGSSMLKMRILLKYDSTNDKVYAELAS